jgi:hypothetical protein
LLFPAPSPNDMSEDLDNRWKALIARILDPTEIKGPVGDVIRAFGEFGFAGYLKNPENACDQCILVSETFASMCIHRGLLAESVHGFCFIQLPQFRQEVVLAANTLGFFLVGQSLEYLSATTTIYLLAAFLLVLSIAIAGNVRLSPL